MGSSLLLLLLFLLFWLKKEYKEQYELLTKDSNLLFYQVVNEVKDSLLFLDLTQKAMLLDQRADSLRKNPALTFVQKNDRKPKMSITANSDTIIKIPTLENKDSTRRFNLQMDGNDPLQSKKVVVKAISFAMKEFSTGDSVFIEIGPDSLPMTRLNSLFSDTLFSMHEKLDFTIYRIGENEEIPSLPGILTKKQTGDFSQKNQYYAQIKGYQWYLIKKIGPQILFSLFLFSITALSFFLIYQSWQSQSRLTQIKNDFISNITHELKTPITTVGVALEALSDFEVLENPQRTQEYLGISQSELKRLNLLVDKVLQLSKFEKQQPTLKLEHIELDQVIEQILNSMKLQFEKYEAQVDFQKTGHHFQLEADRSHLNSVVYNLIDNALKYSKDCPRILIQLRDKGDHLAFTIQDNGMGIPKAYHDKIFNKFFRIPSGDRHNVKGHGLGLSYVAGIVQQHRGSIRLESMEGKGATFFIELPKYQDIV